MKSAIAIVVIALLFGIANSSVISNRIDYEREVDSNMNSYEDKLLISHIVSSFFFK